MSFPAKYKSTCFNCLGPIKPGDLIWAFGRPVRRLKYAHVKCPKKLSKQLELPLKGAGP